MKMTKEKNKNKTQSPPKVKGRKKTGLDDPTPWKTKLGRPVEFDAELAIELLEGEIAEYLANRKKAMAYWEELPTNTNGGVTYRGKPFTTVGTIALACGVDVNTLIAHVNAKNEDGSLKNEQLFRSYQRFKDLGQIRLIEGGASGAYSPNFVAFVGNVNYGMIPKQQVEQTVEIKSMEAVYQQLDAIHNKELERLEEQKKEMMERKALLDQMEDEE